MVLEDHGLSPSELCMVGDRLDTDVLFGHGGGLQTLLVLSGATSLDQLVSTAAAATAAAAAATSDSGLVLPDSGLVLPDYYAPSIAALKRN